MSCIHFHYFQIIARKDQLLDRAAHFTSLWVDFIIIKGAPGSWFQPRADSAFSGWFLLLRKLSRRNGLHQSLGTAPGKTECCLEIGKIICHHCLHQISFSCIYWIIMSLDAQPCCLLFGRKYIFLSLMDVGPSDKRLEEQKDVTCWA